MGSVGMYILWPFDLLYGPLLYLMVIWYILGSAGICIFCKEKSGNTARHPFFSQQFLSYSVLLASNFSLAFLHH
jgi:hypothetical protein